MTVRVIPWIIAVLFVSMSGCKDVNNPLDESSNVVFPSANVSYAQHVQPLFTQTCIFSGCHGYGAQTSKLRLTSYELLMYGDGTNGPTFAVRPKDPENSPLVWHIEGRPGFDRMPLYRNPLNLNQIQGIRAWIGEGANNN